MFEARQDGRHSSLVRVLFPAIAIGVVAFFLEIPAAHAVPSFARKYQTSCITCHTVFPVLNPFGEAFRRDGFRFPSEHGSLDSDAVKAEMLALGQEEYEQLFPDAVWPDAIPVAVPLSVVANGEAGVNIPHTDARARAGSVFAWNDVMGEVALFGAGAFNDTLTYFLELSVGEDAAEIEHAYLVWNDIGAPHLFNLAFGRIAPTLTSWGRHGSYVSDSLLAAPGIGSLYNASAPAGSVTNAFGRPDGVELNGIAGHRVDYSLGWVASGASEELDAPNSQDVYAHLGAKIGGMSLDGEGRGGTLVSDPMRPWAETSLTLDAFGYHALARVDNGTASGAPTPQDDRIDALGGTLRAQLESLTVTLGVLVERHSAPYAGLTPPADPALEADVDNVADLSPGLGVVQFNELSYVVFPWLVPVARTELTRITLDDAHGAGSANVLRFLPGVTALLRPNLKLTLLAEIDRATGVPPTMTWEPTGALVGVLASGASKLEAERVLASLAWGF